MNKMIFYAKLDPGGFRAFQECSGGSRAFQQCSRGSQRFSERPRAFQRVSSTFRRVPGVFQGVSGNFTDVSVHFTRFEKHFMVNQAVPESLWRFQRRSMDVVSYWSTQNCTMLCGTPTPYLHGTVMSRTAAGVSGACRGDLWGAKERQSRVKASENTRSQSRSPPALIGSRKGSETHVDGTKERGWVL